MLLRELVGSVNDRGERHHVGRVISIGSPTAWKRELIDMSNRELKGVSDYGVEPPIIHEPVKIGPGVTDRLLELLPIAAQERRPITFAIARREHIVNRAADRVAEVFMDVPLRTNGQILPVVEDRIDELRRGEVRLVYRSCAERPFCRAVECLNQSLGDFTDFCGSRGAGQFTRVNLRNVFF